MEFKKKQNAPRGSESLPAELLCNQYNLNATANPIAQLNIVLRLLVLIQLNTLNFMDSKITYLYNSAQPAVLPSSANWSRVASADRVGIIESLAVIWLGGWILYAIVTCISQTVA